VSPFDLFVDFGIDDPPAFKDILLERRVEGLDD
jgi:hypothetical protein